ncbi:MAG: TIGR02587 family membrane protein [Pegethrix bostrychoides GSE-TBD4-15B]|jgi:putative integral membrane protein (TIGR02587 family)|uniref:TIGR02587 family membrane protein n=1 Tax=Pegethrix bostrychoides GSE-TBD4-15B TaxID=2839662 RepID=A0A951U671_9CYAN|nr:TIGR02587 family membrane protein [Pegethrix bostrychoides GSE-TBD4-15B]
MRQISLPTQRQWQQEITELVRGLSGGFLFGVPLLYTMEVWWIGSYLDPPLMLVILAVTFVILFLLNRTDGFRQFSPDQPWQAVMDSIEALALGILCTVLLLVLLRQITGQTPLNEALGKVILEGVPFAIGVALARSIMQGQAGDDDPKSANSEQPNASATYNATLADIGATLIGAIFIAFNIAPTDEVPMLAAATSPVWLLAVIATSLLISYGIVFAANFTTQARRLQADGLFQKPLVETVLAYLLSLAAAAAMLWFFQRLNFSDPWTSWLTQTLILGLPATVGGAAGRLAV